MQFIPIEMQVGEQAHRRSISDSKYINRADSIRKIINAVNISISEKKQRGATFNNIQALYLDGYFSAEDLADAVFEGLISSSEKTEILNSRTAQPKTYTYVQEKSYGLVDGEHAHVWTWTQTLAPTCTVDGSESATCSKCVKTKTRAIAALGHDWGEWTTISTVDNVQTQQRTCSRCGATETREQQLDS